MRRAGSRWNSARRGCFLAFKEPLAVSRTDLNGSILGLRAAEAVRSFYHKVTLPAHARLSARRRSSVVDNGYLVSSKIDLTRPSKSIAGITVIQCAGEIAMTEPPTNDAVSYRLFEEEKVN
jgi:hypothetical protein